MKKALALILALVLVFAFTACGSAAAASAPAEASSVAESAAESVSEAESVAESAAASDVTDTSAWDQYADVLTVTYLGTTDAGEGVVFCSDENVTFAILSIANAETMESVSAVGEVTEDENGYLTITDETSNYALTFEVIDNGDGTLTLDMGDLGSCTIAACEQKDAFEALAITDQYTNAVA